MKVTFACFDESIASSRLRAKIPQIELAKLGHERGRDILVYGKHIVTQDQVRLFKKSVYDVCDDHYGDQFADYYLTHTARADLVTCNSEAMRDAIKIHAQRDAVVIPDPYESEERLAGIGEGLFWFGHPSNIETIKPYADLGVNVLTSPDWTRERQLEGLEKCAAVLLPSGNKPARSANRLIEAVRNGRFAICGPLPAYDEFKEWMWVGDIREGVDWFNAHQNEVKYRITACQDYIRDRFSPAAIGKQWESALIQL